MEPSAADSAETRRLLELAGQGDGRALDRLFARHRRYLRRLVTLRLGRQLLARVDPSDVVQETQVEALRRLEDYLARRPMAFRLWLRKTACERLVMARRRHAEAQRRAVAREVTLSRGAAVQLARQPLARGRTPAEEALRKEAGREVRQSLARLAEEDREVVFLRNFEGLSNAEAAQVLGLSPDAASKRYGRALVRLRKLLLEQGMGDSRP